MVPVDAEVCDECREAFANPSATNWLFHVCVSKSRASFASCSKGSRMNNLATIRDRYQQDEGGERFQQLSLTFGLNDLEAFVSVAREAKEWISAHALKL
jgi:hypothetical protein